MYEEPTNVAGDFSMVRSVGQIDNEEETDLRPRLVNITGRIISSSVGVRLRNVGFFNPNGPLAPFRSLAELEELIRAQGQVVF